MVPAIRHLKVQRTARIFSLNNSELPTRQIFMVLHGYGMHAGSFVKEFEVLAVPGTMVIAPEGLSRFYKRGYTGDVVASWMTKEDRDDEINDYIAFLDQVIADLDSEPDTNLHVIGFSQGASAASRWAMRGNWKIRNLVLWCGEFATDVISLPKRDFRLLVVNATQDEFITNEAASATISKLTESGFNPLTFTYEGNHMINQAMLLRLKNELGV